MADFLTKLTDSGLVDKATLMYGLMNAAPATYGAETAQVDDFESKMNNFSGDLTAHVAAQAAAKSKTKAKEASRAALENIIRLLVKQARLKGVSAENIAALGIPTEGEKGASSSATRPAGRVDTSQRLRHTIHFADEATPDSKRKPAGVLGCEIYRKIDGEPPVDAKQCEFLTLDTATPYLSEFDGATAGKMVHYMMRWRMKDESTSAWSETVSATVTG